MAGHLGPSWSPTFGSHIYGPGSWGLYQRKLECDTIVIFIQRARLVSRNHAWYTRCHTNKTEITSFDFIFRALKLHLIMIVHLSRGGAHHLLWLCNGQISNYCPAPRRSPCLWNSISSLELAQGCTNVILNRDKVYMSEEYKEFNLNHTKCKMDANPLHVDYFVPCTRISDPWWVEQSVWNPGEWRAQWGALDGPLVPVGQCQQSVLPHLYCYQNRQFCHIFAMWARLAEKRQLRMVSQYRQKAPIPNFFPE